MGANTFKWLIYERGLPAKRHIMYGSKHAQFIRESFQKSLTTEADGRPGKAGVRYEDDE